jgi:hypothetical protein
MVLSETHSSDRRFLEGLWLLLVIRRGLWLGECLGVTDCRADVLYETYLRTFVSDIWEAHIERVTSRRRRPGAERYVGCMVSFSGSQLSPFFQRRSATAASFRARVSFAISFGTPPATQRS